MKAPTKAATRSKSMAAASVAPASTWLTTRALPNDLGEIHIVSSGLLECDTPGNGGLRVWNYADKAAATKEAEGLAVAMSAKHKTYNTGFAGAKVVCAADKPVADWTAADRETLLAAASIYQELYGDPDDGSIPATFQLIYLTGWAPHESQQRPLARGSAQVSLKDLNLPGGPSVAETPSALPGKAGGPGAKLDD